MLPPGFVVYLEGGGVHPPHCVVCAHAAHFEGWLICTEYGAYVSLHSSCGSFERAERGQPIVSEKEVEARFKSGLVDLRGGKR
jgi:hypothetical protein